MKKFKLITALVLTLLSALTANAQHEYVDLGLPSGTLWATCNVGANSPEEYGDYFAWGETEPKSNYVWDTYKWMNEGQSSWTQINKYTCADGQTEACWYDSNGNFIGDNKLELDPEDDAATANWGSAWQMPSLDQMQELINSSYTTTEWTQVNGVNGYKITSKSNGKSIFLPAAGNRSGTSLNSVVSYGRYWSRSLYTGYSDIAYSLDFGSDDIYWYYSGRNYGQSVRPVRVKKVEREEVYTEFVEETGTLTYYYDTQRGERTGITELYDPVNNPDAARFTGYYKKVTKAVIDPSMKDAPLTSMYSMFWGGINNETFAFQTLSKMTEIIGIKNLNTAGVTRMDWMFEGCNSLQTVDVSSFDISKVTKMDFMFGDCYELTTIYCSEDWSNSPANSDYMFVGCKKLVGGEGTPFDSNVLDATYARPDGGPSKPGYFTEKPSLQGDLNSDGKVDIADAVTVLNIMASGEYNADADLNGDKKVDIADFVTILNIMAAQ